MDPIECPRLLVPGADRRSNHPADSHPTNSRPTGTNRAGNSRGRSNRAANIRDRNNRTRSNPGSGRIDSRPASSRLLLAGIDPVSRRPTATHVATPHHRRTVLDHRPGRFRRAPSSSDATGDRSPDRPPRQQRSRRGRKHRTPVRLLRPVPRIRRVSTHERRTSSRAAPGMPRASNRSRSPTRAGNPQRLRNADRNPRGRNLPDHNEIRVHPGLRSRASADDGVGAF